MGIATGIAPSHHPPCSATTMTSGQCVHLRAGGTRHACILQGLWIAGCYTVFQLKVRASPMAQCVWKLVDDDVPRSSRAATTVAVEPPQMGRALPQHRPHQERALFSTCGNTVLPPSSVPRPLCGLAHRERFPSQVVHRASFVRHRRTWRQAPPPGTDACSE